MGYQLGIDLGTTYTAAAVCHPSDRHRVEPEVVTLGSRNATVASVLYLAPDGSVLIGEAAERRALTDPDRVVREFKRRIGDPTPIVVAGRAWAPEELSARLVRWVVDRVAEREGGPADRIAVTHPASWGSHKKDLLARALAAHGLTVTFLAEPQAAALHYATAERVGPGSTIAVYDLGGGTFDAAVVRKGDPASPGSGPAGFGLLGRPEGLERLGGIDFDDVVFEHVRAGLPGAFEDLDDTDPAVLTAVARMRRDCTEAKEALSSDTEVSIPVLLPGSRGSVRLHRSEFEAMIRPQVEDTVEALRKAVASAGLAPEQLSAVLLVGGSSRIPLVAQLVSEQLGRPVAVDADPKNAIAKGAALALSPRPTASWPGVAVPPAGVPGGRAAGRGAGAAAAGAAGAAALAAGGVAAAGLAGGAAVAAARSAPAVRPPRPALPGHGSGDDRGAAGPPPGGTPAPRRPPGPTHESATSLLSGAAGRDGHRAPEREPSWQPPQEREPWDREPSWARDPEPPPRRPMGLLVGIGGLLVTAVVAVLVLLWPDSSSPRLGVDTGNTGGGVTTTEVAPTPDGAASEVPGTPDTGDGRPADDPPAEPSSRSEDAPRPPGTSRTAVPPPPPPSSSTSAPEPTDPPTTTTSAGSTAFPTTTPSTTPTVTTEPPVAGSGPAAAATSGSTL